MASQSLGEMLAFLSQGDSGELRLPDFTPPPMPQMQAMNMPEMRQGGSGRGLLMLMEGLNMYKDYKGQQADKQLLSELSEKGDNIDIKGKATKLMMANNPNLQRLGSSLFEQQLSPAQARAIQHFTGGVEGKPLMRQEMQITPDGQAIPLGHAYSAYQEPVRYGGLVTTTPDVFPSLPEGSQIQQDSRGQYHKLNVAPEKYTQFTDPASLARVERNLTTGKEGITNPTEMQGKANANQIRTIGLNNQYNDLINSGFDPTQKTEKAFFEKAMEGMVNSESPLISSLGSAAMSDQARQYKGIRDAWNEVNLRDESGASIQRTEWSAKDRINWPMPGDSQKIIGQKAERRRLLEEGVMGKKGYQGETRPADKPKLTYNKALEIARKRGLIK